MSKMYTAEVIADSISPEGHRITTVKAIYPHAVHKDMLRHRNQNRNVESFRAQPPEILINNLRMGHGFKPDVFAKRTKGMGQSHSEIPDSLRAERLWDWLMEQSCAIAEEFLKMDIAKQQVNFVLQDFCPLTEIITATDWSNFFALRTEVNEDGTPVARPEVYKTACAIRDAIAASTPAKFERNWVHLPFLTDKELELLCDVRDNSDPIGVASNESHWISVSAGRCARISWGEYEWWKEDHLKSLDRAHKLISKGHMSPYEQQAKPFSEARCNLVDRLHYAVDACTLVPDIERAEMKRQLEYSGNLHGWVPARKMFLNEHDYSLLEH